MAIVLHLLVMAPMRCAKFVVNDHRFAVAFHDAVGALGRVSLAQDVLFAM